MKGFICSMFTKKKIRLEITLQYGKFGNGTNTVIIEDLPISVSIKKEGFPSMNTAKIFVTGLSSELMEALTFLNYRILTINRNYISIYAGDESGMSLAFSGEISLAKPNFNNAPSVRMEFDAFTGYSSRMIAAPPLSIKGNIPVSDLCSQIAEKMGFNFVNDGVDKIAKNPRLSGSYMSKLINLAKDYNIGINVDDGTVRIFNKGASDRVMLSVSDENGLIGYPSFEQNGISCSVEYTPNVRLWDKFEIQTVLSKASGQWFIQSIEHRLDANIQGGLWQTDLKGSYTTYV
jgi:hypothetical protein